MQVDIVDNRQQAEMVISFLCSSNAFDFEMTEFRIKARRKGVLDSLQKDNQEFWHIQDGSEIVGAIGIAENERKNGGYYLHYFAVHQDYRKKGLGSELLATAEKFVTKKSGRFILIDTGSIKLFSPSRKFYQKHGYQEVGRIPDYYEPGDDCIYYYKKVSV